GECFTATCVVRLLVRMLEPYKGRGFDPCCGSAGMFVQSERFVEEHQGRIGDISIFGQESNPTTWKLAHMNLAIRGIEAHLGQSWADSFLNDQHKDLKADYILANPPLQCLRLVRAFAARRPTLSSPHPPLPGRHGSRQRRRSRMRFPVALSPEI